MTEEIIDRLSQLLSAQNQQQQGAIGLNAVSLKLPDFWTKSPEVWFARIEAQFGIKNINNDQTKYDYVVSTLDVNTAEEVQAVLINPPTENKYEHLKASLLKTYGKSQAQKDAELLNLSGLGDRRPTALLRKINALNDDPKTLKRALFLANLPHEIKTVLAGHDIEDTEKLAEAADRIWETRSTNYAVSSVGMERSPPDQPCSSESCIGEVNAFYKNNRRPGTGPPKPRYQYQASICTYHKKFGPKAYRCQPGCKFASLVTNKKTTGNGPADH